MGMTFPKVALSETYISARWRMQRNVSLLCIAYVPQRNMLVQTQGRTVMQIYLYNFQIVAGSYPTTLERGQNKFLSASKPQCRHTHSSEFVLAVFGTGRWFQAPVQAVKGRS